MKEETGKKVELVVCKLPMLYKESENFVTTEVRGVFTTLAITRFLIFFLTFVSLFSVLLNLIRFNTNNKRHFLINGDTK